MPFAQRIDWKKLRQAMKDAEAGRVEDWRMDPGKVKLGGPDRYPWTWCAGWRTTLYCIASHARGHLHMTKKRIPCCDCFGGLIDVPFTMADQEALIGDRWKQFAAPEVKAVVNG